MRRSWGGVSFESLGRLKPETEPTGRIREYRHKLRRGVRPNRYAAGPFCRFALAQTAGGRGVYAITVGGALRYIGRCADISTRLGPGGYGSIAARACHSDGQATNCKVNALVLASTKAGRPVSVWFHRTSRHKAVERALLRRLEPPWNGPYDILAGRGDGRRGATAVSATAAAFRRALRRQFTRAARAGERSVRVQAGALHRLVGGYPGPRHRMPTCCQIMQSERCPGDTVLRSPPRGAGASLTIEYRVPRGSRTAGPKRRTRRVRMIRIPMGRDAVSRARTDSIATTWV
jgi:hypothetical protein